MQLSLFRSEPLPSPPPPPPKKPDPREGMREKLSPHLPEDAIDFVIDWIIENKVQLRISRSRTTKLGDYRFPRPGAIPRISVNHNLNKYSFLITLLHEIAHHAVFTIWNKQAKPHGQEWKSAYRKLMAPFLNSVIFPGEVLSVLLDYFENPRASSTTDRQLSRILKSFDQPNGKKVLETLPFDSVFQLPNGRQFRKIEKIRTRYKCVCLRTKKTYLFNPLAEVFHQ